MTPWDWTCLTARWLRDRGWAVCDLGPREELVAQHRGTATRIMVPVGARPTAAAAQQLAALAPGGGGITASQDSRPSPPVSTNRSREEDT